MEETATLAKFAAELQYWDLPSPVIEKAKDHILDQFGVQLASSIMPWSKIVYKFVMGLGSKPECTVVGYGGKASALDAAFANGCFGHGFEIDDTFQETGIHPGCFSVSSAFALGEKERIDGKGFITAVVAGYEVSGRIGWACWDWHISGRGFHPTACFGHFGAAAAGGRILGLDAKRMSHAFSIVAGEVGGTTQFIREGGATVKRTYGGKPAYGGLRAALLASMGITGPAKVLEGDSGVFKLLSDNPHPERISQGLGSDFVIVRTSFKHHACGAWMQGQADCALKIRNEHGVRPEQVEQITVGTRKSGAFVIGADIKEPENVSDSQFSTPFIVAVALVKGGAGFMDFTEENVRDPVIREVARRVKVVGDEECEKFIAQGMFPCRVTVQTKGGATYTEFLPNYRGTPSNPMTRREIQDKFRALASVVLARDKVERLVSLIEGLETARDISLLSPLLVRDP